MRGLTAMALRWRGFLLPLAFGLLLFIVPFVHVGAAGAALGVVLLLALLATVALHVSLVGGRANEPRRSKRPLLRTPRQVAEATFVVVVFGALAAIVVSLLVAVGASSVVGDGSLLVRVLLVFFVLGPCMSIGLRCGRWWAFAGAAGLLPLLGFSVLLVGPRSLSGLGFVLVAVVACAFAVAVGSLDRELAFQMRRHRFRDARRTRPPLRRPAADVQVELSRSSLGN